MLSILYLAAASLLQNLRSLTCVHVRLSALIACIHDSFLRSSDTPSIVKFLFLNFSWAATTLGFSMRQGPHQLAQKSTSTYFPRNDDSETGLPAVSFCVKSMACVPTAPILLSSI